MKQKRLISLVLALSLTMCGSNSTSEVIEGVEDIETTETQEDTQEKTQTEQNQVQQPPNSNPFLDPGFADCLINEFGEERYFKITKLIYKDLDERLQNSKYLSGDNYTIADIATWPWIARHEWHDIGLKNYENLARWYLDIASRDAVIKGYDLFKNGSVADTKIGLSSEEDLKNWVSSHL